MRTLVVGSSDIDIFLSPESNSSYTQTEKEVSFKLGDKIPINLSEMKLGGNGSNVSIALKKLGLDVSFYTDMSEDVLGREMKETIERSGVSLIESEIKPKSSSLSLIFDFDKDRVIFSHHEKLNHNFDATRVSDIQSLYLTSIGEDWQKAYLDVLSYVQSHPLLLAFSPGSHQLKENNDVIFEVLAASKILFVNKEEGERLLAKKKEVANDMRELLFKLSQFGPDIVSVTDAQNGSYSYSENAYYAVPSYDENLHSVDKTGAGDSYASAFFGALILGENIKTAMMWGAVNAQGVMSRVGAQDGLLTKDEIESMLVARSDFQVMQI
ncbi:MAG: carbohydrate kinase family protein [Candidatus Levybacteria bacterium]|nr:carbohydrate kinase family protein [Candidatus Levybacteria bacterium]MBP9815143.1 carbohydrate kinase family protein [Candidatus Levybacteria bacterium]